MGYCMSQTGSNFFLAKENKSLALEAIKNLKGQETIKDGSGSHFSWVDTNEFMNATSLQSAMHAWRWDLEEDDEGNVVDINFVGEKSGDDYVLFDVIARYVKDGSYIQMVGEDNCIWRWVFNGNTCADISPTW